VSAELIDRMRARATIIRAGARTVPLTTDKTTIARLATDPTGSWRAENALVGESDPTFQGVTFNTRTLAALVRVSRELLEDSINIEEALMNAFAQAMSLELDRVGLFGSGSGEEPTGVFSTAGIGAVGMGTNGAQITNFSEILDAIQTLQDANAEAPTAAILAPRTWRTISGFVDTTGQPLRMPQAIESLPFMATTQVPVNQTQGTATNASSIIIGNFQDLMIGVRTSLRVEVLRERYAEYLQYGFLAYLRADIQVARPGSFCVVNGIIP
jgi:HK97 family phage major capsid protein